jgi:hypothetical protein
MVAAAVAPGIRAEGDRGISDFPDAGAVAPEDAGGALRYGP